MQLSEEQKITAFSAALLFCVTAAFIVLKSARDALILSDYAIQLLPYFMAISTFISTVAATVIVRLHRSFSLEGLVDFTFKTFAGGTVILWGAIQVGWQFAVPLLYIWTAIYVTIAPVQAWLTVSNHLLIRQARRNLGWIGAGGILGASGGGIFSRFIADWTSVTALLPAASVLILLALFATQALNMYRTLIDTTGRSHALEQPRRAFVILTLLLVSTGTIVSTFADFQFKVVAQRNLPDAVALAEFFGSFYAWTGAATLLFQLVITPYLMSRATVSATLAFLPAGLAIGNALIFSNETLNAARVLKGSEQLFKHSIDRSSLEVLYMAIPENAKNRLKALIDSIGVRASEGFAAVFLILLVSLAQVPISFLALISLALCGASIAVAFLLHREYPRALKAAIQHREVDVSNVKAEFFTSDFYNVIPELLKSAKKETVLDLLQLLVNTKHRKLQSYIEPLLDHEDPEVRLKALQLMFSQSEDFSRRVEKLTNDPDRRIRVEAIHYLCFRGKSNPHELLAQLMVDPDPGIQAAACACSLNEPSEATQKLAYDRLEEMLSKISDSSSLEVRIEVAHILEYVHPSESSNTLIRRLLSDPDPVVRKAMLRSVARTKPAAILEILFPMAHDAAVRSELRAALAAYGDDAVPFLRKQLMDHTVSLDIRKMLVKIMADIATPQALQVLFSVAIGPNLALRFTAMKSLNRLQRRTSLSQFRSLLASLLEQELTGYEIEIQRLEYFAPRPGGLMERILRERQRWSLERIFRTLGLMYDWKSIYNAYLSISGTNPRIADSALEFLDNILAPEHRHRILSLLEPPAGKKLGLRFPAARKGVLLSYLGARDELPGAAGLVDLTTSEWTQWRDEISELLKAFPGMRLIEETFEWRSSNMNAEPKLERKLPTVQKIEQLGKINIFSHLGPQELLLLANESREVEFPKGTTIYKEGDRGTEFYSLVRGKVQMFRGNELIIEIVEGQVFGELSALGDQPHLYQAVAAEECFCLMIDKETFWEILEDYPEMFRGLLKMIASRFHELANRQHQVK